MRKVKIKMANEKRFLIATLTIIIGFAFYAEAASRVAVSTTPGATPTRRSIAISAATTPTSEPVATTSTEERPTDTEEETVVTNRSAEFEITVSSVLDSALEDNSFAEQIRKQRATLAANEATSAAQAASKSTSNTCDRDLRKCMMEKCGNDLTKCALDGATLFGDKLNACRRNTECTSEEFRLFNTEITADRDMNVRLASFDKVINCGNQYNACIINECGTTYNKCLGKKYADAAIQKCATIAKECTESDSGLTNRFGIAISKLRENAEKEVKKDEDRMYAMRESMSSICKRMGAMFDERSFDCVFTVNFFAGDNQTAPIASRKRYAGDTFVCTQEWFGVNVTTYKENAYRETRAQTGASSAMLGSGVGTAVGLATSGAIGRALETQKAKKELKQEEKTQEQEKNQAEKEAQTLDKTKKESNKDNNTSPTTTQNEESTDTQNSGQSAWDEQQEYNKQKEAQDFFNPEKNTPNTIKTPEEKEAEDVDKMFGAINDKHNKATKEIMDNADKALNDAGIAEWKRNLNKNYSSETNMGYENSSNNNTGNSVATQQTTRRQSRR